MLLSAATPFSLLAAQSAGARRPATAPDTRRSTPGTETRTPPASVATAPSSTSKASNTSIGLRVGTVGLGVDVSHLLSDHIGLRVGASYLKASYKRRFPEQQNNNVTWDLTVKANAFSGLLDWYPGRRGVFRLSAGAITTPFKGDGVGVIGVDSAYVLSGRIYRPASIVGTLIASGGYASVMPYVGLGFGTPASKHRGVGFICDLGVAIGRSTVALTSTTAATTTNPTLRQDLAAKQSEWQNDTLDRIPIYPVLNLGVAYRF